MTENKVQDCKGIKMTCDRSNGNFNITKNSQLAIDVARDFALAPCHQYMLLQPSFIKGRSMSSFLWKTKILDRLDNVNNSVISTHANQNALEMLIKAMELMENQHLYQGYDYNSVLVYINGGKNWQLKAIISQVPDDSIIQNGCKFYYTVNPFCTLGQNKTVEMKK